MLIYQSFPPFPYTLLQVYGSFILGIHDCQKFGVQASTAQGQAGDWNLLKLFEW